ncbi:MAG TPA: aldo/keto reductase [Verrucomicrobiota bacterium]|nr:aldo/keto reductase [Verrucomicrobiota bacterium]
MKTSQRPTAASDRNFTRRKFLQKSLIAVGAALAAPHLAIGEPAIKRTAADQVLLGKTGVRISRLGIGTGSNNGAVQKRLGQEEFNRFVRYAYDQGITYIDTAQNYRTHEFVAKAIKGLPREKLFIQTKMPWDRPEYLENPLAVLDRYRKELDTDYIDSLLIHCTTEGDWPEKLKPMMDAFSEAKEKKIIRLKGVSCHGLPPLRAATGVQWVDVQLARVNPQGRHVDGETGDWSEPGDVPAAMKEIKAMHEQGRGVIGMKIIGNGDFRNPEDREKSIRYVMTCGFVDAVVIGFGSTTELDEVIGRMNRALAEES